MRLVARIIILLTACLVATASSLAESLSKPRGPILFQPQFLWADSQTTLQGSGYFIQHEAKVYGITSAHLMDFNVGGLISATWLELGSYQPVATFRASVGRPARTTFEQHAHYASDFVIMLPSTAPADTEALHTRFGVALHSHDADLVSPQRRRR